MEKKAVKRVFLTFDDGPSKIYTSDILDILKKAQIKASFFICGKNLERYPEIGKRIAKEGHLMGNHTYSHSYFRALSGFLGKELIKTNDSIERITGVKTNSFRPPWGKTTPWLKKKLKGYGLKMVMWDIDAEDWKQPKARIIARDILNKIFSGAVILLHDGSGTHLKFSRRETVLSLPLIIRHLQKNDYQFETVDKL